MKRIKDKLEDLKCEGDMLFKPLDEMKIPEPSVSNSESFNQKLVQIAAKENSNSNFYHLQFFLKVAVIAAVFGIGWLVGSINNRNSKELIESIESQLESNNKLLVMTLMQQPSASDRILAASVSYSMPNVDNQIIVSLVNALVNDPDPNVKIKCVEALAAHLKPDSLNKVFGNALEFQREPLIQLMIIDYLRSIGNAESKSIVSKFINSDKVDEFVKSEIKGVINL